MSIKQLIPANNTSAIVIEDGRVIRLKVLLFGLCREEGDGDKYDAVSPFVYIPDLNRIDKIDDYDEYAGLEVDGVTLPDEDWLKRMEELKAEDAAEAAAGEPTGAESSEGETHAAQETVQEQSYSEAQAEPAETVEYEPESDSNTEPEPSPEPEPLYPPTPQAEPEAEPEGTQEEDSKEDDTPITY